jgi:glycosyltransferase involved in cell wall biosynthesis
MKNPRVSFLVTCKNDGDALRPLLNLLYQYRENNECVILDDYSTDKTTLDVLSEASEKTPFFSVHGHHLENNYGEHKNFGKSKCTGDYIFQIDSDEIPDAYILENLHALIELNDVDLIWVPRINDFRGVTADHAKQWGWRLTPHEGKSIVNFPDFQSRIFRNVPSIKWKNKLHERIDGHLTFAYLPQYPEYALLHTKTIEKQIDTNNRYNRDFTEAENKGISSETK